MCTDLSDLQRRRVGARIGGGNFAQLAVRSPGTIIVQNIPPHRRTKSLPRVHTPARPSWSTLRAAPAGTGSFHFSPLTPPASGRRLSRHRVWVTAQRLGCAFFPTQRSEGAMLNETTIT